MSGLSGKSGLKDKMFLEMNHIIQLLENSSPNCTWIIYLVSRDVVTEQHKKKKTKKKLILPFPKRFNNNTYNGPTDPRNPSF